MVGAYFLPFISSTTTHSFDVILTGSLGILKSCVHATSHSSLLPPSQLHRNLIATSLLTHLMPTTTRSGLQRVDPPPSKRKRSNADEQTRKRPKSEKDNEEGVEKKGKGGRDGKKEQKNKKKGKSPRYEVVTAVLSV